MKHQVDYTKCCCRMVESNHKPGLILVVGHSRQWGLELQETSESNLANTTQFQEV